MLRGGIGGALKPPDCRRAEFLYDRTPPSAVCHEGFLSLIAPLLRPDQARLLTQGAVPVSLSGEMRCLTEDLPSFLKGIARYPPSTCVDDLTVSPTRTGITEFAISAPAVSFVGEFQNQEGLYATYCTFDPASESAAAYAGLDRTVLCNPNL
jgi:hypothetical protein